MEKTTAILALFDFDGTLIRGDSIIAYLRTARRLGALSRGEFARACLAALQYRLGRLTEEEAKTRALSFRRHLSPERRTALDAFFASDELLPRLFPAGRAQMERHREMGHLVLLVSASTQNYMDFVLPLLPADALLCTPLAEDGQAGKNCKGEEKVHRIREYLSARGIQADFAASYAYGDSRSDLPMLRLCGHPALVNPSRRLKKAAGDMPCVHWKEEKNGPAARK